MTMPSINHPRILTNGEYRPVLVGDRVRLRADDHVPDPLTVVGIRWTDGTAGDVWIDLTDGVYMLACTVEELDGFRCRPLIPRPTDTERPSP